MSATLTQIFASEALGTFLLILLGCGVVAGVVLPTSKAKDSGWVVITMAWGLAVFVGVYAAYKTGAHLNPARDLGPRITHALLPIPGKGDSDWAYSWVPIVGPLIGAVAAGLIVPHFAGLF